MWPDPGGPGPRLLDLATLSFAVLVPLLALGARHALRRRRLKRGLAGLAGALLCAALAALGALLALGTVGYRGLTQETLAATVTVERVAPQTYRAAFHYPDGMSEQFVLRGDDLYVDAHILKWHPLANALGLRTGYALERVAGRYREVAAERTAPRTVYPLRRERAPLDLFDLVRRRPWLVPWVDAEYGSGTFAPLADARAYEVRVSTSGLLIRPQR